MNAIIPLELIIDPATFTEGFTQSELQTADDCAEKWYLQYNLRLGKKAEGFTWYFVYGDWIHEGLENFYKSKGKDWSFRPEVRDKEKASLEQLQEEEYWKRLAALQLSIYASHYKNDFKFWQPKGEEVQIDLKWEKWRLKGMIDLLMKTRMLKPKMFVWDHKTTGRLDNTIVTGWNFRLQFMFYVWLARKLWPKKKIRGFYVNAIKKPLLRQKQNESLDQLMDRIRIDMLENPEKYFYRNKMVLKKRDIQRFEDTILRPKLERMSLLTDKRVPLEVRTAIARNKNSNNCIKFGHACQFLQACTKGLDIAATTMTIRDTKHRELTAESDREEVFAL